MNLTDLKKCIEVTFFPLMEFKNWLIFTQKNQTCFGLFSLIKAVLDAKINLIFQFLLTI